MPRGGIVSVQPKAAVALQSGCRAIKSTQRLKVWCPRVPPGTYNTEQIPFSLWGCLRPSFQSVDFELCSSPPSAEQSPLASRSADILACGHDGYQTYISGYC